MKEKIYNNNPKWRIFKIYIKKKIKSYNFPLFLDFCFSQDFSKSLKRKEFAKTLKILKFTENQFLKRTVVVLLINNEAIKK